MTSSFLYQSPIILVLLIIFLAFIVASAAGFYIGMKRKDRKNDDMQTYVSAAQGIAFSILGLVLGFTLSVGISRNDARRSVLVAETNAIGTAYLRSQTLPEPFRTEIGNELKNYINIRIQLYEAGRDTEDFGEAAKLTDESHYKLWGQMQRLATEYPSERLMELYMQSLNDMIDAHTTRITTLNNPIPLIALILIIGIAMTAMFFMNINRGMLGERRIWMQAVLGLMIACVIVVIIDLDRPRSGFVYVPNAAMEGLKKFVDEMPQPTVTTKFK